MPGVRVERETKVHDGDVTAVDDVSLGVPGHGRAPVGAGGSAELAIDAAQIHIFDRATGAALELDDSPARVA